MGFTHSFWPSLYSIRVPWGNDRGSNSISNDQMAGWTDHGGKGGHVQAMRSARASPQSLPYPFHVELPFVVERAFLLFSKLKFIKRYSNIWR